MGALAGAIWLVAVAPSQDTAGVAKDDNDGIRKFSDFGVAAAT